MPQTLAVVKLARKSGIPADAVENSFAFAHSTALDGAGADAITAMLKDFYTVTHAPATTSIQDHLSAALSDTVQPEVSFYDITGHLNGGSHGAPTFVRTFGIGLAPAATAMPNEVAVCLSFHGDYLSDTEFGAGGATRPRARHRGRVFIGPIASASIDLDATTKEPAPSFGTRAAIAEAAKHLMGDATWTWSVWSRTRGLLDSVVAGWVDNAFDVQRRRGNQPTDRYTF